MRNRSPRILHQPGVAKQLQVRKPNFAPKSFLPSNSARPIKPQLQSLRPLPNKFPGVKGPIKPGNIKPGFGRPSILSPPGIKPGTIKPGTIKPGIIKPGTIKPGIRPRPQSPHGIHPGTIKPGVTNPKDLQVKPLGPFRPLLPNRPHVNPLPKQPRLPQPRPHTPENNNAPHQGGAHHNLHGLIDFLKPICLPPIIRCPPPRICPPCVLAICPQAEVIVVEPSTEQMLVEFIEEPAAPEFVVDLQVETEVSLEVDGLTGVPGALVLDIHGIGLPVEVLAAGDGTVSIKVPSVGLSEPKLGKLYVLNGDLQLVAAVDARLYPASH